MRKVVLFLMMFLFISSISALCSEGQININNASLEELDKLSGIGPVKAQAIIDTRPFDSIDDLINVSGIGEITLNKIKAQGLACVDSETQSNEEDKKNVSENKSSQSVNKTKQNISVNIQENTSRKSPVQAEVINLNPKDIKSKNNSEKLNGNYAIYGFIAFSILLGVLFMLRKKRYKNEFR